MSTGANAREIAEMIDRGAEYYSDGDVRSAADLWRRAVELAPEDLRVRAYLAWAEARLAADTGSERRHAPPDPVEQEPVTTARGLMDDELTRGRVPVSGGGDESSMASALGDLDPTRLRGSSAQGDSHGVDEDPTGLFMVGVGDPKGWSVPPSVHTDPTRIALDPNPEWTPDLAGTPDRAAIPDRPAAPDHSAMIDNLFEEFDDSPLAATTPLPTGDSVGDDEEMVIEMIAGEPDEPYEPRPPTLRQRLKTPPSPRSGTPSGSQRTPVYEEVSNRWRIGPREDPLASARIAIERGDLEGAFIVAEKVVAKVSGIDSPELIKHEQLLFQIYERQLGDCARAVAVVAPPKALHPRAAFLLSRIDGDMSIDDLRDVSGMPRLETTRLLAVLLRCGAIVAISG